MEATDNSNDDAQPILVQFEHGILNYDLKENVGFKYLRSKIPSSKKRMLVAQTENHSYVGMVTKKQQSLMRYYIGIVDEKTNRIEEIAPCRHCTLKPKLEQRVDLRDPSEMSKEQSFKQKTDTLVEAFGTAKQKRLVASRKKNEEVHNTISDKVSEVAKKIIAKTPATPQTPDVTTDDKEKILPLLNKEATCVDDMYLIDDIISFQEYSSLKELSKEMKDCDDQTLLEWKKEKRYPEFVLHHLSSLPSNASRKEELLCYLFYINQLIYLFQLPPRNIFKGKMEKVPMEIREGLFNKFTSSDGNDGNLCMPKMYKDKVLSHILVIALIIEHYELNCNLLLKDLKLSVTRITKLLRAIGCTVKTIGKRKKSENDTTSPTDIQVHATLHLPKSATKTPTKKTEAPESKESPNIKTDPGTPTKEASNDTTKPAKRTSPPNHTPKGPSTPKKRKIKQEPV